MVPIFYFHSVGNSPLSFSSIKFESLINFLIKKGYESITISEALGDLDKERKYFILTFDDCFHDVFENAIPIMKKYNVKGTFYPVVNYLDRKLYGSKNLRRWSNYESQEFCIPFNFMNLNQIRTLVEIGMEIGNHTLSHPNLDELQDFEQQYEIVGAKVFWESELNISIKSFCFPRGRFTKDTIKIIEKTGHLNSVTTKPEVWNGGFNFEIPRINPPTNRFTLNRILLEKDYGSLSFKERIYSKLLDF